jgi:hypothetical protein
MYIPKNQSACTKQTEATGLDTQEKQQQARTFGDFFLPGEKKIEKIVKNIKSCPTNTQ